MRRLGWALLLGVFAPVIAGQALAATVTRGPYLQNGTPNAVSVRWRTNLPAHSVVRWGPAPGAYTDSVSYPLFDTEHEQRLLNLLPNTTYYYEIASSTETLMTGDSLWFTTAPPSGPPDPTRIWVLGDAGTNTPAQRAVRDAYATWNGTRHTDFMMMLGDNAYNIGTDSDYQNAVFNMYARWLRNMVLWPTRGNHDMIHTGSRNDYYELFTMPTLAEAGGVPSGNEAYYSFDYGNAHFICLDSEGVSRLRSGDMMRWLHSDIAASTKDWVIAFWHHPPYTKGSHDSDNAGDSGGRMRDMRQVALPILDSAGVDLVLTGHSHSYERSFLLNGHYGTSGTLAPSMIMDGGDGREGGDGAYVKTGPGSNPFEGAVYVVAGSSGQTGGGLLNHPVMITSQNRLGSLVIDIENIRLEARFLSDSGVVRDSFAIEKVGPLAVQPRAATEWTIDLSPNPAGADARVGFTMPAPERVRVSVVDASGRRVRTLHEGDLAAGRHAMVWNGDDDGRRMTPPGVYFVVVEAGQRTTARKLVRAR